MSYIVFKGTSPDTLDSLTLIQAPNSEYDDFVIDPSVTAYYQVAAIDTATLTSDRSQILEVSYPMIASSGEEIDFGSTRFLQAVQQPVYLVNNGSNELNIDSIYVEANVGFSTSAGGLLLQVGSSPSGGKTIRQIDTPADPGRGRPGRS